MAPWKQVRLGRIGSTNAYAVARAEEGAGEGLVVVADEQTAGRGRLGRVWLARPGEALLCSVLLRPALPQADLHLVPTAVALAAAQAARLNGAEVALKWPNDLVVGEAKVGGVLAEYVAEPPGIVVGVGVNLVVSAELVAGVESVGGPSTSTITGLSEAAGHPVAREALLAGFLDRLEERYGRLGSSGDQTMDDYRRWCTTLGRRVRVEGPAGELVGRAVRIEDDGSLVVDSDGAEQRIAAADVIHLRDEVAKEH